MITGELSLPSRRFYQRPSLITTLRLTPLKVTALVKALFARLPSSKECR
ncbi:hypothetical protein LINPERPRIM_LOCUS40191 [Linum perenne]